MPNGYINHKGKLDRGPNHSRDMTPDWTDKDILDDIEGHKNRMEKKKRKIKNSPDLSFTKTNPIKSNIQFSKSNRLDFGQYLGKILQEVNKNTIKTKDEMLRYLASLGATEKTATAVINRVLSRRKSPGYK